MASTPQDFAQRLNNSAALCIEVGYHDRAIASLQRALKLCEDRFHDSTLAVANCTLDDCIVFSETSSLASTIRSSSIGSDSNTATTSSESTGPSDDTPSARSTKRRRLDRIPTSSSRNKSTTSHSHSPGTYVYRTPIRIPKQESGNQQQGLGSILYLVIVFNLALAHQLKALELGRRLQRSRNSCGSSPSNVARLASQSVRKSLLLYELLVEYWSKLQRDPERDNIDSPTTATATAAAAASSCNSTTQSLRFRMVLSNNLSRIYRWAGETFKERSCLEDLLSAVLVEQHLCCSATTLRRRSQSQHHYQRHGPVLDGFLSNTATLATDNLSAGAA